MLLKDISSFARYRMSVLTMTIENGAEQTLPYWKHKAQILADLILRARLVTCENVLG